MGKSVHFMTRKHWTAKNNYEELARFVAEVLKKVTSSVTWKQWKIMLHIYLWQHLTNCSQLLTSILKQEWPMELSLVNKVTLGADESTSMSDTSELSIFINYVNPITRTLCDRLLCLVPLGSSKSAGALHKVIVKVFSDRNLNIKDIF